LSPAGRTRLGPAMDWIPGRPQQVWSAGDGKRCIWARWWRPGRDSRPRAAGPLAREMNYGRIRGAITLLTHIWTH